MNNTESIKWWILAAMGLVLGLIMLDETVVGVALASISKNLNMGQLMAHWVINAYVLVISCLVAAAGRLSDLLGLKRVFLIGAAVFGLASLSCALAVNGIDLVISRAFQGLGAAIVFPISMAMLNIIFPAEQRGFAFGIYGAVGTIFIALGPLVGGFFTEMISWRWIFLINIPSVIFIIIVVATLWRIHIEQEKQAFDYLGLLSLIVGLFTLVFALMQAPDWGWANPIIILLFVIAAISLLLFCRIELKVKQPLIDIQLFKSQPFSISNLILFAGQFNKVAIIVFGALFLQYHLGMTPLMTGVALIAAMLPVPITAAIIGKWTDQYGARMLSIIGLLACAVGLLAIALLIPLKSYAWLVGPLILWGASMPLLFVPSQTEIMSAVPEHKQGVAGGISLTSQIVGASIGVAVLGAFLLAGYNYQGIFFTAGGLNLVLLVWRWLVRD